MGIMNNAGELNTAEKGFSRRNFLMGAASAGALAVLGLSGCAPKGKDELSDTGASATGADVNWDEETEVLVVGSGYAGLAAVYEAAKAGAAVRVIEKPATPCTPTGRSPWWARPPRRPRASRTASRPS